MNKILLLITILIFSGMFLGILLYTLFQYINETKKWNNGFCTHCEKRWTFLYKDDCYSIYHCKCDYLVLGVVHR